MSIVDDIKVISGNDDIQNQATQNKPPRKILIVEDEEALAGALEDEFKNEGFIVIKAENGELGLEKAKLEKPDVILLDLLMPVMDGQTMLRRLREIDEFRNLPVVVLTNNGDIENIRETQFYGNAIEFLIKSNVSLKEISKKVKQSIY